VLESVPAAPRTIPFGSHADLEKALDAAHISKKTTKAIVDAIPRGAGRADGR
jgi:hypothetical protein